jgi:hypothetical protein
MRLNLIEWIMMMITANNKLGVYKEAVVFYLKVLFYELARDGNIMLTQTLSFIHLTFYVKTPHY